MNTLDITTNAKVEAPTENQVRALITGADLTLARAQTIFGRMETMSHRLLGADVSESSPPIAAVSSSEFGELREVLSQVDDMLGNILSVLTGLEEI